MRLTSFTVFVLQIVLCWVCIDCFREISLQQQPIRGLLVKTRGRQLPQLSSTAYVSNATEFVAALADPAVGLVRVAVPELVIPGSAWETSGFDLPIAISRDLTIEGDPRLDKWTILDFNYAKAKIRLANNVTFRMRHMFSPTLRVNPSRAPGIDFLMPTPDGGPPARMIMGPAASSFGICFPIAYQANDFSYLPRPSDFPGVNDQSFGLSQAGCVNDSAAYPLTRCWAMKAVITDMAFYGADYDAARDSTIPNNQVYYMVNSTFFCETLVSEDCLGKQGQAPLVCFKEAERRYEAMRTAAAGGQSPSSSSTPSSAAPRDVLSPGGAPGSGVGLASTSVNDTNQHPFITAARRTAVICSATIAGTLLAVVLVVAMVAWARRRGGPTVAAAACGGGSSSNKRNRWEPVKEAGEGPQQQECSHCSSGSSVQQQQRLQAPENGRSQQQRPAAADKGGPPLLAAAAAASGFIPDNFSTQTWRDEHEGGPAPDMQQDAAGRSHVHSGLRASAGDGLPPLIPEAAVAAADSDSVRLAVDRFVKKVGLPQPAEDEPITLLTPPRADVALGVQLQEALEAPLQQQLDQQQILQQPAGALSVTPEKPAEIEEGSLQCTTFITDVTSGGCTATPGAQSSDTSSSGVTFRTAGSTGAYTDGAGSVSACGSSSGPPVVELLPAVLGKGAFGRVVEGMFGGRRVAVKLMACDGPWGGQGVEQQPSDASVSSNAFTRSFVQEVQVLSRVQHPNVVQLLAACVTPPRLCLVMELMEMSLAGLMYGGGDGKDRRPGGLMPLEKVLRIGIDIANALAYLHPTIVHRDLKPANVLINDSASDHPVVKLTDFGLSRLRVTVASTKNGDAGTPPYMAPECFDLDRNKHITHQSDMYSLGVILWEMLTGTVPWSGASPVAVAIMVTFQGLRLPLESLQLDASRCPPKLARLIEACWETDPARRPAAAEAAKELTLLLLLLVRKEAPSVHKHI